MWWCSLLATDHHCGHLLIIPTVFQLFLVSQASSWVCCLCCQWEYLLAFWHRLRIFIDDYRCWPLLAVCIYASGWCPSFHPSVCLSCQLIAGKWLQLLISICWRQRAAVVSVLYSDLREVNQHKVVIWCCLLSSRRHWRVSIPLQVTD